MFNNLNISSHYSLPKRCVKPNFLEKLQGNSGKYFEFQRTLKITVSLDLLLAAMKT